jgi:RimJ/RimL family protein N-acetyltransferase
LAGRVVAPLSAWRALLWDLLCICRRDGVATTLRKAARAAVRRLHSQAEELVLVKRLDEGLEPPPRDCGVRIEPLAPEHLGALAELNRRRCFTRKSLRNAAWLARGYRGFAIYVAGEAAGQIWWVDERLGAGHPEVVERGIELADRDVYSFDYYLDERHRGGGTADAAFHRIECALADLGYRRMWGYVAAENRPARWLYAVRGFEVTGRVVHDRGPLRRVPAVRERLQALASRRA